MVAKAQSGRLHLCDFADGEMRLVEVATSFPMDVYLAPLMAIKDGSGEPTEFGIDWVTSFSPCFKPIADKPE